MGVVSGIIMPFQFGTNWSRFTDATADVLSPLLAYKGLMAFFLEAGRAAVRTAPGAGLGAFLSGRDGGVRNAAVLVLDSFDQFMDANPSGLQGGRGRFVPVDWLVIVFNPSFPYRLLHNVTAFYITTAFVVLGVGAWLVRRMRAVEDARMMMRMALDLLILLVPLQFLLGDQHGLNTRAYQPAKLAAIEGRYDTAAPAPLTLFGIPDDRAERMRYAVEIPVLGSLILTHSWDGAIKGLKGWPAQDRPPVGPPFFAFRIMVGIGVIMLCIAATGQLLRFRRRLRDAHWFLRLCTWVAPLGFVAVIAGWTTTEVGRQPWTVYGLLRTADSVSPSLTGADVALSLVLYVIDYLVMLPTSMGNAMEKRPKKANPPSLDRIPHERPSGNCWRYYTTLTASAARERDKSRRHCAEIGLEYWFQYELGGSLNHAIADDRIAERTPASPIWFAARLQARCIPMITLRRWRFAWHT